MGGKRCCAGLGLLLVPIALSCAGVAAAETKPVPQAERAPAPAIIVLDGSRSMWGKIGGQGKVPLARTAITQALGTYKGKINFGFVAFGHRKAAACADSQLLAKAGELTADNQGKLLFGFKPVTSRPIAAAIIEAAKNGAPGASSLDIVLITDGLDSCKANVCATVKNLKQAAPGFRIHVIGFDPKAKQALKPLRCIAQDTGGQFFSATNASELKQGLTAILDGVAKPSATAAPVAQAEGDETQAPEAETKADEAAQVPPLPTPAPPPPATAAAAPPAAAKSNEATTAPPIVTSEATPKQDQAASAAPETAPSPEDPAEPPAAKGAQPSAKAQANADSPVKAPPPAPADIVGPKAPTQTDMPKLAAVPPHESSAPPRSAPTAQDGSTLPVPVTFKALLTEAGPKVTSGLVWRVFSVEPGPDGARKLITTYHEPNPTAALPPGDYLVNAAFGLSNLTKKVKVESSRSVEETFVLNTGGLKLGAVLANGRPLPQASVHFKILSDEEDQFGNRREILANAKPDLVIRLNAGAYHIVSLYGRANATVRADVTVEPGKITEATIKHAAAPVTFRLVQRPGGEALADTKWSILTPTGDVVKEIAGALPTNILAAGDYAVVANHNGESYTSKFNVATGEAKQIEVVMEQGPATPEVLKAITEPPPPPPSETPGDTPSGPDAGMAFGGGEPATQRPPGIFSNPGALLRPRLP